MTATSGKRRLVLGMVAAVVASCGGASGAPAAAEAARHVTVFAAVDRFGGWPANGGMWIWGNEILVAYTEADHKDIPGHAYDRDTARTMFARSLDGGETWSREDAFTQGVSAEAHDHRIGEGAGPLRDLNEAIDFTHPDFAFLFHRANIHNGPSHFYHTSDRGRTWTGPFRMPDLDTPGFAARTDVLVEDRHGLLAFLTAAKRNGREGRIAAVRTSDGARTWQRVSWVGNEPDGERDFAIMPASARLSPDRLLTVIRHKEGAKVWLTCYRSEDNARSWTRLADPVTDSVNSPAALIRLPDGRLVLAYIFRRHSETGSSVCVRVSEDEGDSWTSEIVLRDNEGASGDSGYPRIVRRPDGTLVITYYWNHAMRKEGPRFRTIQATIWDPGRGSSPSVR